MDRRKFSGSFLVHSFVSLLGCCVLVYKDEHYQGDVKRFCEDSEDLGGWGQQVRSIQILHDG